MNEKLGWLKQLKNGIELIKNNLIQKQPIITSKKKLMKINDSINKFILFVTDWLTDLQIVIIDL